MAQEKKLDVFISSKSEDYPKAREIHKYLVEKGYTVFFAETSIPFGADSLFKKTIDNALDSAKNMIVVCSNPKYIQTGWVYYEWNTFSVEILSGRKLGSNILTVINESLSTDELPIGLRAFQNVYFNNYQFTICSYLGEPSDKPNFVEIDKLIESSPQKVKTVVNEKSKNYTPKTPKHFRLRKILLSVCLSLISVVLVLGTSYTIACKTLRYEYDNSNLSATVVAKKTFFRCRGYVNIPERIKHKGQYFEVRYIGEGAFINYSELTSVTIPNGVIGIGERAFAGCPSLTSVTIPHSVLHVGDYAFSKCSSLSSINIQEGTKSIGEGAFYDCKKIKTVDIPNSVTTIGEGAFYDCHGLTSITIGKNVKTIGNRAFYDCHKLTSLTISDSVTSIGDDAFYDCHGLKSITIGKNVKTIGDRAFRGCTSLSDITIPNSVVTIGYAAFEYCLNIQSLTIGNGVTCIKSTAFKDCNKLMTVTIPKSVTEIGMNAFPMHTKIIRKEDTSRLI